MAVTDTQLLRAQPTGQVKPGGANSYTTVHRVKTDSANDGVQTVAAAIGTPGESTYSAGGETDEGAYLQTVSPRREKDKSLWWTVTSTWAPNDSDNPDNKLNNNGEMEANPTLWADEVSTSTGYIYKPLYEAVYRGPHDIPEIGLTIGEKHPIVNSVGTPFEPPPETEIPIRYHRIRQYNATFPEWKVSSFVGCVNSMDITYTLRIVDPEPGHPNLEYEKTWVAREAKCDSIDGTWGRKNNRFYWRTDITISECRDGWRLHMPDIGFERAHDEENDPAEVGYRTIKRVRLTDVNGHPVCDPVRLDGFGEVLGSAAPTVYLEYSKYPETPFGGIFD